MTRWSSILYCDIFWVNTLSYVLQPCFNLQSVYNSLPTSSDGPRHVDMTLLLSPFQSGRPVRPITALPSLYLHPHWSRGVTVDRFCHVHVDGLHWRLAGLHGQLMSHFENYLFCKIMTIVKVCLLFFVMFFFNLIFCNLIKLNFFLHVYV